MLACLAPFHILTIYKQSKSEFNDININISFTLNLLEVRVNEGVILLLGREGDDNIKICELPLELLNSTFRQQIMTISKHCKKL